MGCIFSFNFSPVTPIFDIPTTESAVQRATTIFQRRRKKILAEVNSLAKNAASSNASKANQQKKLVRKHLDPKETLIGNGHNVENIEKIRGRLTFYILAKLVIKVFRLMLYLQFVLKQIQKLYFLL